MHGTIRAGTSYVLSVVLVIAGCRSSAERQPPLARCAEIEQSLILSKSVAALNQLTDAFARQCYDTVIEYGTKALDEFRHKTFQMIIETFSVFLPDGTLTAYVLESYERGFLSLLLAAGYMPQQQYDDAKVELRRLDHELFTPLYNYGEDPVNLLLSAVFWEHLGEPGEARVDWLRLRDIGGLLRTPDEAIRTFAEQQIGRIDEGRPQGPVWHLYGIGTFSKIDWDLQFTGSDSGYLLLTAPEPFPTACTSETGVLIPARSWFETIAMRHNGAYHPLLNMQSWIRLPMGAIYSFVPVAAGTGITIRGRMLDASSKGNGALCEVSIRGGLVLMSTAPRVFKWALDPDLRHWERLPGAFLVTASPTLALERCRSGDPGLTLLDRRTEQERSVHHG